MSEKVEKTLVNAVVVFPMNDLGELLFAVKTMKIGEGCWNGYGGGVEGEETPEEAAVRELEEESSMIAKIENLEKIGILRAHNHKSDGREVVADVHFYVARKCVGEPKETAEMIAPTWFRLENLPLNEMMPADRFWLPRALAGERLIVTVHYGPFQKEILQPIEVEVLECFDERGEPVRSFESERRSLLR